MNTKALILLVVSLLLASQLHAADTLLSADFSSGSITNNTLAITTNGTWRGNTTSKSIAGGQLRIVSASPYDGVEEGIVGQIFKITSQNGTTISLSFDYNIVASSTMYVHLRGVDSSTTAWSLNTGAQNGNAWDTNTGGTTYRFKDGLVVNGATNADSGSAIVGLSGSGSYSTNIDISGYTLSNVSSYNYMLLGFAFNLTTAGTSWVDNVLLQSYTPVVAAIWDGGGGDTNINTAANWDGDSTPTLTGGTNHLQFGTGGSSVTVNTATNVDKITISRGADFTINSGGNLTVGAGGIIVSSTGGRSHTITGGVTLSANQSVNVVTGETLTVSGGLGGSYGIIKEGGGTLNLTGNNTFNGDILLYSGNTNIQGSGRLGGGNFTGNITVGSTLTFNGTNDQTISGSISGASLIYKYGNATLTLRGSNTMTGDIQMSHSSSNITAGTIRLEHVNALGSKFLIWENDGTIELGVNGITIAGGALIGARNSATDGKRRYRLDLAGSNTGTISGNFDIRMNGVTFDVGVDDILTLSGNMNNGNGAGSWEKTGAGTLVLTGATNTAVGITTISGGTVQVGNGGTSGTLNSISNVVNNGTLVFNRSDTITVANQISGNGSVVQSGSGTLILSGSNTYSGITVINSGTLEAAHANALGTNNTVQVSGGTLLVSASGALNGKDIELNSNTIGLSFNGSYSGTVGSLTLCADSVIDLGYGTIRLLIEDLDLSTYTLSLFNWTGTVSGTGDDTDRIYVGPDLSDEALSKIYFYSGDYGTDSFLGSGFDLGLRQTSWNPGLEGYQIIAVPEPETWATALLLLAVGGLWMCRKINDPS